MLSVLMQNGVIMRGPKKLKKPVSLLWLPHEGEHTLNLAGDELSHDISRMNVDRANRHDLLSIAYNRIKIIHCIFSLSYQTYKMVNKFFYCLWLIDHLLMISYFFKKYKNSKIVASFDHTSPECHAYLGANHSVLFCQLHVMFCYVLQSDT